METISSSKREEDEPAFVRTSRLLAAHAPSPDDNGTDSPTTTEPTETAAMDRQLSPTDFFERICLVLTAGRRGDGNGGLWWPALRFDTIGELQDAVRDDVGVPPADLACLRRKILRWGGKGGGRGVAYLLGRRRVRRSLVALEEEGETRDYYSQVGRIGDGDGYQGHAGFQGACAIVTRRNLELDSDDDSDATGAMGSPPGSPARRRAAPPNPSPAKGCGKRKGRREGGREGESRKVREAAPAAVVGVRRDREEESCKTRGAVPAAVVDGQRIVPVEFRAVLVVHSVEGVDRHARPSRT